MWWWVFAVLYAIYFILGWRELDKKDEREKNKKKDELEKNKKK